MTPNANVFVAGLAMVQIAGDQHGNVINAEFARWVVREGLGLPRPLLN
jgi:hypothetical protein